MPASGKRRKQRNRRENFGIAVRSPYGKYGAYSADHHQLYLDLNPAFLRSLTPQSKVLEVGFGSGRLTDFLLRKTGLKPENIDLVDFDYPGGGAYIKKKVFLALKQNRTRLFKGDVMDHEYPVNHYDHVLVPEATFRALDQLIPKLVRALKPGGTMRLSNVHEKIIKFYSGSNHTGENFFKTWGMEIAGTTARGLILRKK